MGGRFLILRRIGDPSTPPHMMPMVMVMVMLLHTYIRYFGNTTVQKYMLSRTYCDGQR